LSIKDIKRNCLPLKIQLRESEGLLNLMCASKCGIFVPLPSFNELGKEMAVIQETKVHFTT